MAVSLLQGTGGALCGCVDCQSQEIQLGFHCLSPNNYTLVDRPAITSRVTVEDDCQSLNVIVFHVQKTASSRRQSLQNTKNINLTLAGKRLLWLFVKKGSGSGVGGQTACAIVSRTCRTSSRPSPHSTEYSQSNRRVNFFSFFSFENFGNDLIRGHQSNVSTLLLSSLIKSLTYKGIKETFHTGSP